MSQHLCHWPGCGRVVPSKLWGCRYHWMQLPKRIRDRIWNAYVPGQEVTKRPGRDYLYAARAAQEWIRAKNKTPFDAWPADLRTKG